VLTCMKTGAAAVETREVTTRRRVCGPCTHANVCVAAGTYTCETAGLKSRMHAHGVVLESGVRE
jgi:hypothetical protein